MKRTVEQGGAFNNLIQKIYDLDKEVNGLFKDHEQAFRFLNVTRNIMNEINPEMEKYNDQLNELHEEYVMKKGEYDHDKSSFKVKKENEKEYHDKQAKILANTLEFEVDGAEDFINGKILHGLQLNLDILGLLQHISQK